MIQWTGGLTQAKLRTARRIRVVPRPSSSRTTRHSTLSTRARFPGGKEVEWLGDGKDLLAWLSAAGVGDPSVLRLAPTEVGARRLDVIAGQARSLREWLRSFVKRHAGRPLPRSAAGEIRPLNELLGEDNAFRSIEAAPAHARRHGREFRWADLASPSAKHSAGRALLLPIADAIGDLLTAEDFTLVRRCEGTGCSLVFLDRTKNHARRWCSIAWCGNRAKAAAHRARHRGGK